MTPYPPHKVTPKPQESSTYPEVPGYTLTLIPAYIPNSVPPFLMPPPVYPSQLPPTAQESDCQPETASSSLDDTIVTMEAKQIENEIKTLSNRDELNQMSKIEFVEFFNLALVFAGKDAASDDLRREKILNKLLNKYSFSLL